MKKENGILRQADGVGFEVLARGIAAAYQLSHGREVPGGRGRHAVLRLGIEGDLGMHYAPSRTEIMRSADVEWSVDGIEEARNICGRIESGDVYLAVLMGPIPGEPEPEAAAPVLDAEARDLLFRAASMVERLAAKQQYESAGLLERERLALVRHIRAKLQALEDAQDPKASDRVDFQDLKPGDTLPGAKVDE